MPPDRVGAGSLVERESAGVAQVLWSMQLGYGVWLQQLATLKPAPVQMQGQPVAQVESARDDGSRRGQIVVALPGNDPSRSVLKRMRHRDIRIACVVATDVTGRGGAEKGRRDVPRVPEAIGA